MTAVADRNPRLRALVAVFLHTGLRLGDVISLEKAAMIGNHITLRTRKRGKIVRIRIHPEVRAAVDAYVATHNADQKKSPRVFSTFAGNPLTKTDKLLRAMWKVSGVKGGHAQRFRDTFAVRLLASGASLYDVAKLLGIGVDVAEKHYAPYVRELEERGARLIEGLDFSIMSKSWPRPDSDCVQIVRRIGSDCPTFTIYREKRWVRERRANAMDAKQSIDFAAKKIGAEART